MSEQYFVNCEYVYFFLAHITQTYSAMKKRPVLGVTPHHHPDSRRSSDGNWLPNDADIHTKFNISMFSTQLFSHNFKINKALKTICVKKVR